MFLKIFVVIICAHRTLRLITLLVRLYFNNKLPLDQSKRAFTLSFVRKEIMQGQIYWRLYSKYILLIAPQKNRPLITSFLSHAVYVNCPSAIALIICTIPPIMTLSMMSGEMNFQQICHLVFNRFPVIK